MVLVMTCTDVGNRSNVYGRVCPERPPFRTTYSRRFAIKIPAIFALRPLNGQAQKNMFYLGFIRRVGPHKYKLY